MHEEAEPETEGSIGGFALGMLTKDTEVVQSIASFEGVKFRKIKVTLDSGAAVSAGPESLFSYTVKKDALSSKYRTATNAEVTDKGYREIQGLNENWMWQTIKARVTSPEVHKVILAASAAIKAGNRIVLDDDNSWIINKATGWRTRVYMEDDIFVFPLWVPEKHFKKVSESKNKDVYQLAEEILKIASRGESTLDNAVIEKLSKGQGFGRQGQHP